MSSPDLNQDSSNSLEQGSVQEMQGILKLIPFVNKGGRAIPGLADYFIETGTESYFIRLSAGKVRAEELEPLVGQKIKVEASLREGLWDTDDPNVQSRIGKYIVIFRIL